MSNVQSYNALIDRFKAFASGHFILKTFSHGQIDTADLEKFTEYPFMHVVPSNVTYAKGTKTFSFQIVLADLPRDKDDKVEFQREVLSDLQRIAEDLVAEITNHRVLFGDLITVQNVSLEPFLEEFHNTLTGWTISLELLVPYYWDACSIPAEWNDMFESGSGGTGSILTFIDSITRDEYGNVSLVNDEATPAPNYYYGTNDEGVRGWYLLTDEVGLTCATIGSCQTIIDIEAEIDLLQQDVTDLQADVVAIETELPNKVPYTGATQDVDLGEYELKAGQVEFDQTPTGTAGVAVMRWNDSDGTLDLGLKGGNVTLQVGQESVLRVVNKTATNVNLLEANYQAVRVTGAQGQRLKVDLALATTDPLSAETLGLVTETINNNQEGFITTSGLVRGINTTGSLQGETWADGDILYLSPTTAGNATKVKPTAPNHLIVLGYVVRAHVNQGSIFVKVDNGYELDELHNVYIASPANNNVLTYESSTSLWKNKTVETALGFTPVPTTRSLTINGTTQDLSADRTFTIATGLTVGTTPITSGTVGRVLFEGTGNVLQEDVAFNWDSNFGRLELTTTNLTSSCLLIKNSTTSNQLTLRAANTDSLIGFNNRLFFLTSTTLTISQAGNVGIGISNPTTKFQVATGTIALNTTSGNTLIGTTTDAGYKLDVNGTARVSGALTANTLTLIGNTLFIASANVGGLFSTRYTNSVSYSGGHVFTNSTTNISATSGDNITLQSVQGFAPTSGTATYAGFSIVPTINQTGGANGITRGLYVNPTLTSAADFRAIETTAGNVLFGSNFFWDNTNGRLGIGTNNPSAYYAKKLVIAAPDEDGVTILGNTISSTNYLAFADGTVGNQAFRGYISYKHQTDQLTFGAAGTLRMTIASTGNVLINTTTDAGYKLDVNGTARVQGNAQFGTGFYWDNTNSRLGIGTASPTQKIEVVGAVKATNLQASGISTLATCFMYGYLTEDNNSNRIYLNANQLDFWTNGSSSLRITKATKNVLIGTTTDAGYKLDVNGTARIGNSTNGWQFSSNNITIVSNGFLGVDVAGSKHFSITDKFSFSTFYFRVAPTTGNILIGTSTDVASSKLTVESTTRGFLPPRMTTTQKNAIASPAAGLQVFDITLNQMSYYNGTSWVNI